ncbi:hypothetical protein EDC96DRAFT_495295 [Choanephora cucurbitarum]|nr:hypothetical protein EDC96DRAFT_495295 [Choanephora cucurbitarum]
MNILQNRIESFKKTPNPWPHTDLKYDIEAFAKAGFYHVRRPRIADSVRCFLCDLEVSQWTKARSPYLRHTKESPQCPWVLLNFPDTSNSTEMEHQTLNSPSMQKARLLTFQHHNYWPPHKGKQTRAKKYPAAYKVADAGFFLSPTLKEPAQIKCPYCQVTISEPDREIDLLQKHQVLSSQCPFLKLKLNAGANRGTINSLQSSESFKTASSQLHQEENMQRKRKQMEPAKQQTRFVKQKIESMKEDQAKEETIWDIDGTFSATPPHIKKPAITFGKQSSRRDRKRERVLPSSKRESAVDIFSEALEPTFQLKQEVQMSSKPQIEKQQPKEQSKEKAEEQSEKQSSNAIQKAEISITPCFIDRHPTYQQAEVAVTISSPKRDKGKGRAVESPASIAYAANRLSNQSSPRLSLQLKKPISLSKSKTPSTSPPRSTHSISLRHSLPEQKEEDGVIYLGRPLSPQHSIQFLQSTPVHKNRSNQVSAADIFGDCPFSPIVQTAAHQHDSMTPSFATPSRIRPSVTQSESKRWRAFSPPKSPSFTTEGTPPILSIGDIVPQLPPARISSEQETMTVEHFLQNTIEASIHKVKEHGSHVIEMIKQKSNQVKSELLQQTTGTSS